MGSFDLTAVLLALPVLLLSLTAHEFAHAWVALKQGDDTAYKQGRVSMNPMAHLDWIGTVAFPIISIGSRVMYHLLPSHLKQQYLNLYPYGMFILWGLVLTGALRLLSPFIRGIANLFIYPSGYAI